MIRQSCTYLTSFPTTPPGVQRDSFPRVNRRHGEGHPYKRTGITKANTGITQVPICGGRRDAIVWGEGLLQVLLHSWNKSADFSGSLCPGDYKHIPALTKPGLLWRMEGSRAGHVERLQGPHGVIEPLESLNTQTRSTGSDIEH